jgi:hypothetical protein
MLSTDVILLRWPHCGAGSQYGKRHGMLARILKDRKKPKKHKKTQKTQKKSAQDHLLMKNKTIFLCI